MTIYKQENGVIEIQKIISSIHPFILILEEEEEE